MKHTHFNNAPLSELVRYEMSKQGIDLETTFNADELINIDVYCTKADVHTCVWDFILGKPLDGLNDE